MLTTRIALTLGILGMASVGATAADLPRKAPAPYVPPAPVYNWTGFYVGANGGWGWATGDVDVTATGAAAIADLGTGTHSFSKSINGAVFGGQLGYNYQFNPNWVVGFEGDFDGAGISGTGSTVFQGLGLGVPAGSTDGVTGTAKIKWLATARARLGYTWGPGMVYVTGGGAWEKVSFDVMASGNVGPLQFNETAIGSFDHTNSGWTVGGGWEYMITPSWTVRAEYLYYHFNNNNNLLATNFPVCAPVTCGIASTTTSNHVNVARLGVNYKFGGFGY